jgi:glycosyltransferase involved in cell wall biosynthesis
MYNESASIGNNIELVIKALEALGVTWEYILVDDGSRDDSLKKAQEVMDDNPSCRIIHYDKNRGRGYALKQGFAAARGKYVIATESDLTWGAEIIGALYNGLKDSKKDMIIASVNLSGGGLENVPFYRTVLSRCGNWVMRWAFGRNLTMLSGMTRGYRNEAIKSLYLEENGKEIHLEIVSKAQALGYDIGEIPATIRWEKKDDRSKKRGGLRILHSIIPHIMVSLHVGSVKLLIWAAVSTGVLGAITLVAGILNKFYIIHPMPYLVTYGLILVTLAMLFGLFGLISIQLGFVYRSMTHIQSELKQCQIEKNNIR